MSSWNQIKNKLLQFSKSHPQVNSFGTGDPISIGTDEVINLLNPTQDRIVYPLVFANVRQGAFNASLRTLQVELYVMDKTTTQRDKPAEVASWRDNNDEVISDCFEILSDYVSILQDDPALDYTLNESVSANAFYSERDDDVTGWFATLTFELPFSRSICIIPE
jgi:hypothetical protein